MLIFLGALFSNLGPLCMCFSLFPLTLLRLFSRRRTHPVSKEGWCSLPKPHSTAYFTHQKDSDTSSIFPPNPSWTWLVDPWRTPYKLFLPKMRGSAFYYNRRLLIWAASQVSMHHKITIGFITYSFLRA